MEKKIISVSTTKELVEKVKLYQKDNFLPSFSAAITMLVMKSLEKEER